MLGSEKIFSHSEKVFTGSGKIFSHSENVFSHSEKVFTGSENVFSHSENVFSHSEKVFTGSENVFSHSENVFTDNGKIFGHSENVFSHSENVVTGSENVVSGSENVVSHSENALGASNCAAGIANYSVFDSIWMNAHALKFSAVNIKANGARAIMLKHNFFHNYNKFIFSVVIVPSMEYKDFHIVFTAFLRNICYAHPGIDQKEVALFLGIEPSNFNHMINRSRSVGGKTLIQILSKVDFPCEKILEGFEQCLHQKMEKIRREKEKRKRKRKKKRRKG